MRQRGNEVGFRFTIDFSSYYIPRAINHIKFRDLSNVSKRDIAGCHDITEFNKVRQVDVIGNPNYTVKVGEKLDDVEEIIIMSKQNHSVPGVIKIEYKIPASDGRHVIQIGGKNVNKGYTTGATKGRKATENYEKTIYDPKIWTDDKLEKALKEAINDVYGRNGNLLIGKNIGKTV